MHSSTDIRLVKCLDGLHYSFELLEHAYKHLHDTCDGINTDTTMLIPALSKCWMIIDLVHRIRELAQALPGLSTKNQELRTFLHATNVAENFRHYIQHLRGELSKSDINPFPVWGTLSWVDLKDPTKCYIAIAGASLPNTQYTSCVYDVHERKWVSNVTLGVANLSFNFDPIYALSCQFRDFVIPWIVEKYSPGISMSENACVITIKTAPSHEHGTKSC